MAGRESAGAVYVTIDADASPLLAKYQQAEAQSRAAGQRIATGLGSGLQTATGLVDQFGRSISSGITAPLVAAAPAAEKTAVAIRAVGDAASHSIPPVAALGGEIRVLSGEQSIRAVERFGVSVLGLGAAAQAVFPLFGAIAVGELFSRVYERVTKVTEGEKAAAEQAKQFTSEIKTLDTEVETLRVRFETMRNGAQAGLSAELKAAGDQIREAATALQDAQDKLHGGVRQTVGGRQIIVPAHTSSIQRTPEAAAAEIAGQQLEKAEMEALLKSAELDKKRQEEIKAAAALERAAFKDKYDNQLADMKAAHEVTRAEELKFRQVELADAQSRGPGFGPVATELNRQIGSLSQEVDRGVDKTSSEGRKLQVEQAKTLMKGLHETMIRELEEASAEGQRTIEEDRRVFSELTSEAVKRGDEGIKSAGVKQQSTDELSKLQIQQQYSLQLVHNRQDELAYAVQIAAADERALSDRIAELEELKLYETLTGQVKEANQTDLQIEQAKAALLKQQVQDQTIIATKIQQQSLAGQIQSAVGKGPATLLDAGNQIAAQGITTAVDGIAGALGRAAQGGERLGKIFSDLGRSILGSVVQGIAKIGLQMAITAITGKALGSSIAVAEVTSAAAVGAANAAASTAAIPIIGPELAPAAAAATFAEIMAFAPLAAYAKGGRPEPGVPYLVGENGPELRIDDGPGVIIPNHVAFGGSVSSPLMTSSMVSNSASSALSIGSIHLHGIQSVEEFARRLPNVLKSRAPNFSPASR